MGILRDNLEIALSNHREQRKRQAKWAGIFALFVLLSVLAAFVKSLMVKGADYLGGKATVEKFFRANLVRLILMCVLFVAFLFVFIKTWNGMKSSIEQLIYTAATGLILVIFSISALMPVLKIANELKRPATIEVNKYTLCTADANKYYVAFDDADGGVLLQIPEDKYLEFRSGKPSDNGAGFAYDEIAANSSYQNVQFYRSTLKVTYYDKSVIYESAALTQTGNN